MSEPEQNPFPDPQSDDSAIRATFLLVLIEDREQGLQHDVAHYQRRFPGYEDVIASEFAACEAEPAIPEDQASGASSSRYRVDGELGRGGMGVVQRVFDQALQRYLARKQVHAGAGVAEKARFLDEARVTAQLDHPGVVAVYDVGRDESGAPFFTMPMVRGRTFAALIDELHAAPSLPWPRIVEVLIRICETVAFAHSRGVVHRDLKPHNVMVGRFGEVYVVDWGLARAIGRMVATRRPEGEPPTHRYDDDRPAKTPSWTVAGEVLGTPAYMAPEQIAGDGEASCQMDVYAIGAILYHALAGHPPYGDADDVTRSMTERATAGPPTAIAKLAPDAPPELVAICERAMAREPRLRYADAEAVRDDLRAYAAGRVVGAYERGKWAELRKWIVRNRAITASALAAVLALVMGLVASLVQADRAEASFHDSVAAVDRMLARVARAKLRDLPETTAVRRDLLRDATEFFERFLEQRPHDVALRKQAAASYYQVASLHYQLGDREAAQRANARSLALIEASRADAPDDPDLLYFTAQAYMQRGSELATEEGAGDADLERALALLDELLTQAREPQRVALAGAVRDALALSSYRARKLDDAERHAKAAIALRQEQVAHSGDRCLGQVGASHSLLAGVFAMRDEDAATAEQLQLAITALRRFVELFPDDSIGRSRLAEALRNQAIQLHRMRDEPGAEASVAEAVAMSENLVRRFPQVLPRRADYANALVQQARIRHENGAPEDALRLTAQALEATERALLLSPGNRQIAVVRFDAHRVRHRAASRLGRYTVVAANATALAEFDPAPGSWVFEAACQLGDAVRMLDGAPSNDQRGRQRRDYCERAVAWLRELVERRGMPRSQLAERRLDPLRDHAEFPSPR